MTFKLDTSGVVTVTRFDAANYLSYPESFCWDSLDLFTQGYVEALFAASTYDLSTEDRGTLQLGRFSDLAPETLARIVEDCARLVRLGAGNSAEEGASHWRIRQEPNKFTDRPAFPPLTAYLGDDGKVYLREAGQ